MSKTILEERLRWVLPIVEKKMKIVQCALVCPYSKRTLERWISLYRKYGETGLIPLSTRPNFHPYETPLYIKQAVLELRSETYGDCALKLHWELESRGIMIAPRTIGKILKSESVVRIYRRKRIKYTYVKAREYPGDMIEIDVKEIPSTMIGHKQYQYTATDRASRWRHLEVYSEQINSNSVQFIHTLVRVFPYTITAIKTDNGSIFTNYYTSTNKRSDNTVKTLHVVDTVCKQYGIIHYLIDPGKPQQNGRVERSHRTDDDKLYKQVTIPSQTKEELRYYVRLWNMKYNATRHISLSGKTPNQMITDYPLYIHKIKPPNVCA